MTMRRFMAAGLAAAFLALAGGSAWAGWWDKADDATPVDLTEVIGSPDAYRGKEITFDCTFHGISTFYNPYFTRFVPSEYVNFSVWPAARKLWRESDYMESFAFMFLERGHKNYEQLLGMKRYTRLRLTGYVQNTFKNVPWIEVRHVEVLTGALTTDSIRAIVRGDEAAKAGRLDEALVHWDAAAGQNLPADVMASVDVKRGQAYAGLGRTEDARGALARAVAADPGNPEAKEALAKLDERTLVKPVDPKRYEPAPMAMPVPVKQPEAPKVVPVAPKAPEPAPEAPTIVLPGTPEKAEPKAEPQPQPAPKAEAEPAPKAEAEPAPQVVPPAVPETKPELPAEEPVKEPVPEKRMSGPM